MTSTLFRLDRGVILWSVTLYITLVVPVSFLHELGHAYICTVSGFDYSLWIDETGGHTLCSGMPKDLILYGAAGGAFGLLGSTAIVGMWAFVKRHPALLVIGLAYAVDQITKLILEGFFARIYLSGSIDLLVTVLQLTSWVGLTLYFARTRTTQTTIRNLK
jgi:hypothetical protein